jgi:hypothetical protein
LDSERFLLNVRYGYARIKSDYLIAQSDMERALGTRFPEKTEETGTAGTSHDGEKGTTQDDMHGRL